jgi:hypothetical protein
MRDHVKIVAILNIVLGCLGVLGGVVVLIIFGGLAGMIGLSQNQAAPPATALFAIIGGCIAIFLFVLSVPGIIGGWGMLNFRPWARILMIIISALNLLHFPLGTALGIYGLIVLLNEDTRRLFETGGAYVPLPAYPPTGYGQPPYAPPGSQPPAYPQQTYSQPPPPPPNPGS